jgi:hypothetical protein
MWKRWIYRRHHRADRDASVLRLCAAVVPGSTKPAGYSFLAELDDTFAEQISIEAARRNSISACSRICLRRRSCSAGSTSAIRKSGRPRSSPIESGTVSSMLQRTACGRAGLRREIHAPPYRIRKTEGDVRCRGKCAQRDQLTAHRPFTEPDIPATKGRPDRGIRAETVLNWPESGGSGRI